MSCSCVDGLLLALAIFATRASFRTMNLVASARNRRHRRVLVYGAGGYGRLLVREMRANPAWKMNPVGFIDDDPMKAHRWIVGVPVRGSIDELEQTMHRYSVDEVVLSSPSINGKVEHPHQRGLRASPASGQAAGHEDHVRRAQAQSRNRRPSIHLTRGRRSPLRVGAGAGASDDWRIARSGRARRARRRRCLRESQHVPESWHPPTNLGWAAVGLPRAARRAAVDLIHAPAYTAPLSCRRAHRPHDSRRQLRASPGVVSVSP